MLLTRDKKATAKPSPSRINLKNRQRLEPVAVLLFGFLTLVLLTPHVYEWLNPPTGDEPFYLVTTISLLRDHDLDETNNYAQRDYQDFAPTCQDMTKLNWGHVGAKAIDSVPGLYAFGLRECPNTPNGFDDLPPHSSKNTIRSGTYTKHGLGLSVLIAPAYALGGRFLVMVFMNLLTALVALNCWLLAYEMTGQKRVAWFAWAAMLFTSPLLAYAFLIFPAIPAALIIIYSWRRLRLAAQARLTAQEQGKPAAEVNGLGRALLIGLCLGFLPWLHSVFLSISIPLFLYFLLGGRMRYWRSALPGWSPIKAAVLLFPIIILGGLFLSYYLYLYGTPLPNTQDHAGFAPLELAWLGVIGFFFDQKYGLLIYAPFYLLAFIGLYLMFLRTPDHWQTLRRRSDLCWLGVALLPNFLVMSSYNQWWGEWGPPARYLVPLVPLLAAPFAIALTEARNRFTRVFLGVALVWSVLISVGWMINPHLMFHWQDKNPAKLLTWLQDNVTGDLGMGNWFPSFVSFLDINNGEANYIAPVAWICSTLIMADLLVFFIRRKPREKRSED